MLFGKVLQERLHLTLKVEVGMRVFKVNAICLVRCCWPHHGTKLNTVVVSNTMHRVTFFYSVLRPFQAFSLISRRINR